MFDEWKEKRKLRREIKLLEKERFALDIQKPLFDGVPKPSEISEVNSKLFNRNRELAAIETDQLYRKAQKFGIEFPKNKHNWWWDDIDHEGENFRNYLTDIGKASVLRLIREERRKDIEWWVKIIGGVITLLTGLAGSIIGIIAVLKN